MAHLARDGEVPPLCYQMLLYPGTDMSMSQASYRRDFTQFPLSIEAIEYFIGHYLRDKSDYTDPRAAPLLALPNATVHSGPNLSHDSLDGF